MAQKKPPAPETLAPTGAAMWERIVDQWDLRADELRTLSDACHEADLIDRMQEYVGGDLMSTGSQGQPIVHPMVAEIRQHRSTLSALLKKLDLPDPEDSAEARSTKARAAANARWHSRAG